VRLQEIEQSLDLINTANKMESERTDINLSDSGEGSAQLESSRGTISLAISVNDGMVEQLQLETPSQPLAGLVPTLTEEAELSDALVQIASLDIAPWEIEFEGMEVNQ
jgi:Ni,Fe-hydrogenase III large subunit